MAYTALYRKLRPQTFSGVVGQEAIVRTLTNQIKTGRISHAYLFCGSRGTGKTSTAKIFARAVNCEQEKAGEPCNECQSCRDILQIRGMNVIEIDAASNNGVDNIRDIREEVKYPPAEGRFKVYIIDEVHMLSAGAFNALLKTLEEPPEHVIFILATTDPQKIPATILSRCQRFDFKRIGNDEMVNTMRRFITDEGVQAEEEALRAIAQVSDGAMRDSLSLLDQCIAFYYNETITLENVLRLLGAVDVGVLFRFADAVYESDSEAALRIIGDLFMDGRDVSQFTVDVIQHFRNLLVAAFVEKKTLALDFSDERIKQYREQGKKINNALLFSYINTFSLLQSQLRYASNPRIMLEIATLKLCAPAGDMSLESISARLSKLEQEISALRSPGTIVPAPVAPGTIVGTIVPAPAAAWDWQEFVKSLDNPLRTILLSCQTRRTADDSVLIFCSDEPKKLFLEKRASWLAEKWADKYAYNKEEIHFIFQLSDAPPPDNNLLEELQSKINMKIDYE